MFPLCRRSFRYSVMATWFAVLVGMSGCGKGDKSKPVATRDARPVANADTALQKEIELALKLETVLDNTKKDLQVAEQANPRDEARIAERKEAVKAVTARLEQSRRAIEILRARGEK